MAQGSDAPGLPWEDGRFRASSPPSRPRFIHWLTAPSLPPHAFAMSFCFHPCCFSFQACLRRSSRQSAFFGAPILLSLGSDRLGVYFSLTRSVAALMPQYREQLRMIAIRRLAEHFGEDQATIEALVTAAIG
jgi:hypothetical protein